jgi:hypothetical protein
VNRICCEPISTGSQRATRGVRIVAGGPHPAAFVRHCCKSVGWIIPGSILVLLPKCPACIVAYLAIAGGIGISITAAAYLRMALVILCGTLLVYLAANCFRPARARRSRSTRTVQNRRESCQALRSRDS